MCDDSGIIYAGDDGVVMVDLDSMSPTGILGSLGDLILDPDDLDEQTKRELLVNGFNPAKLPNPNPKCRWCKGTGKVKLLVSESDCDCVSR